MTRPHGQVITDAARRMYDSYALHRLADPINSVGKWFAFRLTDGGSDGTLYDTKSDAVRHQHNNERYYGFIRIMPSMQLPDFQGYLDLQRKLFDKGLKMADPDDSTGGRDMIRRSTREDQYNQLRALFVGDRAPSNIDHG